MLWPVGSVISWVAVASKQGLLQQGTSPVCSASGSPVQGQEGRAAT